MAARKTNRENGLFWMESLSEKLGRERECAEVLEHCCCQQDMIEWMDGDAAEALNWPRKFGEGWGNLAASPRLNLFSLK
jgi:hypothetical protein